MAFPEYYCALISEQRSGVAEQVREELELAGGAELVVWGGGAFQAEVYIELMVSGIGDFVDTLCCQLLPIYIH